MTPGEEITTAYAPGEAVDVPQHDGSVLRLRKLHADYDATDRYAALSIMQQRAAQGEIVTGLLYLDPLATDLHVSLNTVTEPLHALGRDILCPGSAVLDRINAALR